MSTPADIPFQQLLDALLDVDTPFHPRFLYRLSDLDKADLAKLGATWPQVPAWRRQALLEDVEQLGESDYLLSFEALGRFALRDEDSKVRLPAVRTLWEYEELDLIPDFLNLMERDTDTEVRAAAATALGHYVYLGELEEISEEDLSNIEDHLLNVTNSAEDALIRRRALESLGYSGRDEVPLLIEKAFASGNKDWIISALFAMGRSANERWQPDVLAMLDSNLPAIRFEAARAVGELEISEAVPHLIELLDDPGESVREAAIWSLSQIGGEGVREVLEQEYEQAEDEEEAEYLESALDNLAFTEDVQLLPLFEFPEEGEEAEELDEDLDDLVEGLFDSEDEEDSEGSEDFED